MWLRAIVNKVLVNLIRNQKEIVLNGQLRYGFKFRQCEDLPCWVRRSVQQNGASARRDCGPHRIYVKLPVRLCQRHQHRIYAQRVKRVHMVAVERLEDEHLVAGIEQRHHSGMEAGRRAGRDHHFVFGIVGQPVVALLLGRNGLAQPCNAVASRIDVLPLADGLDRRGFNHVGHRRIAHALRQVDAPCAVAFGGHGADFGLQRLGRESA